MRELIEGRERGGDFTSGNIFFRGIERLAQPDIAQRARKRFMFLRNGANDIDVFETGLPIEAKVGQVLSEESETFAEKKNRDQREDDDGDERVAAEESLIALFERRLSPPRWRPSRSRRAANRQRQLSHAENDARTASAGRQFI